MRNAFTLIELLVVVTIIVILLALLTPAMDRALYQAELTVCAANQGGIANGVTLYAAGNRRNYPARRAHFEAFYKRPNMMRADNGADDMTPLRDYLSLEMFIDPLNAQLVEADVDPEQDLDPDTNLYVNYGIWWGWRYTVPGGGRGSAKMGQGFGWDGRNHSVLVGDWELVYNLVRTINVHPSPDGTGTPQVARNLQSGATYKETLSRFWYIGNTARLDFNFAMNDGSVVRFDAVAIGDERLARVPYSSGDGGDVPRLDNYQLYYSPVPRY